MTELLIVLAIVLLVFGARRLPQLGRQLGTGMRDFREAVVRRHDEPDVDVREGDAVPVPRELPPGDR